MTVRMKDIAQDLGVSVMTVSKALRNHSDISEATRERVLKHAQKLNYQPNWAARSLVTRRTYMVGLVIPDLMHSFFAQVAKGASRKLQTLGYQTVIANTEEDIDVEERQIELLLSRNVDGLIVASAHLNGQKSALARSRVPFVLLDRLLPGIEANFVGLRDEEIGAMATEHLVRQGCKNIAHIRGPQISPAQGRFQGYRRTLLKHGRRTIPQHVVAGGSHDFEGYAAMQQLLATRPRPDGVFCFNDPVAAGAVKAILEAGLGVPGDIAIVGAGNVHYSDLLRVPLSTVDQSSYALGEKAAEVLCRLLQTKSRTKPQSLYLAPRLIVRDSSRRVKSAAVSATST